MGALYMGNVCVVYKGCNLYQSPHFPTTKQSKLCQLDYNSLISNIIWPTYCAIHQEKSSMGNSSMINGVVFCFVFLSFLLADHSFYQI